MRLRILGSGSAGNCAVMHTEQARVLIDVGFTHRKLRQLLHDAGEALERIDAVFITHEHGDHCAGIEGLKKFPHIKVFANAARMMSLGLIDAAVLPDRIVTMDSLPRAGRSSKLDRTALSELVRA